MTIQKRTKRSYFQDNFQTISGTISNIGTEWKTTFLLTSPIQGRIIRVRAVSDVNSTDYMALRILDGSTINDVNTLLYYKNVPVLGNGLDSGEEIPYSGSKLYLATKFYAGEGNSLQYKLSIQTQGTLGNAAIATSPYRIMPPLALGHNLNPEFRNDVMLKLRKFYDLTDQLASQLEGDTVDLILSPAAMTETIMVIIDGQVMLPPQVIGEDPNESGDYEILSETHVKLNFVPDEESQIVLMYIEK